RDVPRGRVLLELAEDAPAQYIGQKDVQGDRRRVELARQHERLQAARRHNDLEAVVAGDIDQDARIVRVILDDQQGRVAGLQGVAVVRDWLDRTVGEADDGQRIALADRRALTRALVVCRGRPHDGGRRGGTDIGLWQVERERAAGARGAAQLNLAAQEIGEL